MNRDNGRRLFGGLPAVPQGPMQLVVTSPLDNRQLLTLVAGHVRQAHPDVEPSEVLLEAVALMRHAAYIVERGILDAALRTAQEQARSEILAAEAAARGEPESA